MYSRVQSGLLQYMYCTYVPTSLLSREVLERGGLVHVLHVCRSQASLETRIIHIVLVHVHTSQHRSAVANALV